MSSPAAYAWYALQLGFVFLLYVGAALAGFRLETVNTFAALVWAPTGIAIAALYFGGYRLLPAIAAGAFLANILQGAIPPAAFGIALGNALEAVVTVSILQGSGFRPLFSRLTDSVTFIVAVLCGTLASATIGIASLSAGGYVPEGDALITWLAWWIADALGALVIGALLIRWLSRGIQFSERTRLQWLESLGFLVVTAATAILISWEPIPQIPFELLPFLMFVPLIWGAMRVGPRIMTLAVAAIAFIAIAGTASGTGPFVTETLRTMFGQEIFIAILAMISLLFIAAVEERKEAARQLRAHAARLEESVREISSADQAKNDFIAILSHELRNPLSPVLSVVELMRLKGAAETTPQQVESMYHNVYRISRLLDDLLDITRISQQKFSLSMDRISVQAHLEHAIEMTAQAIASCGHTLTTSFPEEDAVIEADPLRFEQIVVNLLNNAVKYTPRGGRIYLSCMAHPSTVEIRVADTGIGIPREERERIFEPFQQLNREAHGNTGLGIGLSLTKRLVDLHGGVIRVESEGKGRGSTFIVVFPRVLEAPQPARAPFRFANARGEGERILIIDDNQAAADGMATLLSHIGYDARVDYAPEAALRTLPDFDPDIVLMDIGLPQMDGRELARRIRAARPETRLIAVSGFARNHDQLESDPFDEYLTKPVGVADLDAALRRARKPHV